MSEHENDLPEQHHEPLIPREPLEDDLQLNDGRQFTLTRDNSVLVEYPGEYDYMSHLYIRLLGSYGMRLFDIKATPIYDYMVERGYDRYISKYPDDVTVAIWENMMRTQMERELEDGTGHELDED